jgi:hypothetical protein
MSERFAPGWTGADASAMKSGCASNRDEAKYEPSIDPLVAIVLGVAGFVVGLAIMFYESRHSDPSAEFVDSTSGWVWMVLIAAQVAFWAVVAIPLWSGLRNRHHRYTACLDGSRIRSVLFAALFVAVPAAALRVTPPMNGLSDPLYYHQTKIAVISVLSWGTVVLPALVGMFWVYTIADRLAPEGDVEDYTDVRDSLQRLLKILGAVIALSTLSTGALLQAIAEKAPKSAPPLSELALLWGGGATVLLMAAYVPAYLKVQAWGKALVTSLLGERALGSDEWFDWDARRKTLDAYLQIDQGLLDRLESGIFILAPLLAAAVSVAVPH